METTRNRFGMVAIPSFVFFGIIQYAPEPIAKKTLFAVFSTIACLISIIFPFFRVTFSKEVRDSLSQETAFLARTAIQMLGNICWLFEGMIMGDIAMEITSSAGIVAGFAKGIIQAQFDIKEEKRDICIQGYLSYGFGQL